MQNINHAACNGNPLTDLAEIFDSLPLPSGRVMRRLLDVEGVPFCVLNQLRSAWVGFDGRGGFDFDVTMQGPRALILRCIEFGEVVDLCGWSQAAGTMATFRGYGFAIGDASDCFNPASWAFGSALPIHSSPLDWLRDGAMGICILEPTLIRAYLQHVPRFICSREFTAQMVHKHLSAPKPNPKIFVKKEVEAA